MRNRLNVPWKGKRTTARFPDYLWRLSLSATGLDDEAMSLKVQEFVRFTTCDVNKTTASSLVQSYLVNLIELELFHAGFNPGTAAHPDQPEHQNTSGVSPADSSREPSGTTGPLKASL